MKKYKQHISPSIFKPTVVYNYVLFFALVISQILMLVDVFNRNETWISNDRIIALYTGLVGSFLLVPLLAYLFGYFATHKSTTPRLRQFNGVVFGLTAFWLSFVLNSVAVMISIPRPNYIPLQVHQFGYAAIAVIILFIIGIFYRRSTQKRTILTYLPLACISVGCLLFWFINIVIGAYSTDYIGMNNPTANGIVAAMSIISIPLLFIIAYKFAPINITGKFAKIMFSSLSTALYMTTILAFVMLLTSSNFTSFIDLTLSSILSYLIGFVVWGFYMYKIKTHT